jgi:hypothetical protein
VAKRRKKNCSRKKRKCFFLEMRQKKNYENFLNLFASLSTTVLSFLSRAFANRRQIFHIFHFFYLCCDKAKEKNAEKFRVKV